MIWEVVRPSRSRAVARSVVHGCSVTSAVIALGACASARPSQEPLVSDRPDFTEAVETLAPGRVQLEGGHTFSRAAAEKTNTSGEVLLRIGVASRAELRLEAGSYSTLTSPLTDVRGREDGAVGMKVRLHDAPDSGRSIVPALSLLVATSVPTGSSVFRQRAMQPEAKLASAWTLSDRVSFAANVNVARPVDGSDRFTEWAASGSLGVSLTERYGLYAEVFGFAPQLSGAPRTAYANSGLTAGVTPSFQLDIRAGVGLNGTGPDYFVGAGFAKRW
jgi:hypothetical protein